MKTLILGISLALITSLTGISQEKGFEKFYRLDTIPLPEGQKSADALAFMPDGRLVVCLSFENIYTYHPDTKRWQLFAEGLHQPLGITVVSNTEIIVAQRPEVTAIRDTDGDGKADHYETLSDQFGLSGNYAEWTFGPVRGPDGNIYYSLGTGSNNGGLQTGEVRGSYSAAGHDGRMNSSVPYRGWIMQISPDGKTRPWANGFREANGLGFDLHGNLFTIDNQGDFVGTSGLYHVERGKFYGHPHSLVWREGFERHPFDVPLHELDALRTRPAVLFPHGTMSNSPTQPLCDTTKGRFGPFAGQMFLGEMNSARIIRVMLEEVDGQLQGACAPFFEGEGLQLGNNRLAFDPNGKSLWIGQTLYESWVGQSGLQRLTWTGEVPFEVQAMRLTADGFDLSFTKPVDPALAEDLSTWVMTRNFYNYHEAYGSKTYDLRPVKILSATLRDQGMRVSLRVKDLAAWHTYDLRPKGLVARDGSALAHPWVVYNLNRLVANTPPPPRPLPNPQPGRKTPRLPKGGVLSIGHPQVADSTVRAAARAETARGVYVRRHGDAYRFTEKNREILTYNRSALGKPDGSYTRGHYIHPLFGLDGEPMSDDMPADHPHHRGIFWAWTQLWIDQVRIGNPWEQKQLSWDVRDVKIWNEAETAVLKSHVLWRSPLWLDKQKRQRPIVEEHLVMRVQPEHEGARVIDFEISLRALCAKVRIGGSENAKGYGGFSARIPLPRDLSINAPGGPMKPEPRRPSRREPWTDFSASFGASSGTSGITILCHPDSPGYPEAWTIRTKNSCQNPVYPGDVAVPLPQDKAVVLRYRIVLHRGAYEKARMQRFFEDYTERGR